MFANNVYSLLLFLFAGLPLIKSEVIQFYYLKGEFNSYYVDSTSMVHKNGNLADGKLMMHNAPMHNMMTSKEIGCFSFFESITNRSNSAWIDALGSYIFNDGSKHGSTITFRYSFYTTPGKYFLSPDSIMKTITESGTGKYYGRKFDLNGVFGSEWRNITLTEIMNNEPSSSSTTMSNDDIIGAVVGSAFVSLILSLVIFYFGANYMLKKDDQLIATKKSSSNL